jgi:hypothetical protein
MRLLPLSAGVAFVVVGHYADNVVVGSLMTFESIWFMSSLCIRICDVMEAAVISVIQTSSNI